MPPSWHYPIITIVSKSNNGTKMGNPLKIRPPHPTPPNWKITHPIWCIGLMTTPHITHFAHLTTLFMTFNQCSECNNPTRRTSIIWSSHTNFTPHYLTHPFLFEPSLYSRIQLSHPINTCHCTSAFDVVNAIVVIYHGDIYVTDTTSCLPPPTSNPTTITNLTFANHNKKRKKEFPPSLRLSLAVCGITWDIY